MEPSALLIRFAVEVALKATLFLGVTAGVLLLLRREGAALRHRAAILGLAGVVALPFLSLLLPEWQMPVLREPRAAASRSARPGLRPDSLLHTPEGIPIRPALSPLTPPGPDLIAAVAAWPEGRDGPAADASRLSRQALVLAVWAAGALILFGRLLKAVRGVQRLAAAGVPLDRADGEAWLTDACRLIDCRRPVRLLVSDRVSVPLTSGLLSPIVFLPPAALRWPPERLRIVLLHELAHVRRRDWAALVVRKAAEALYWFHPLAWWVAREARREAERAADDLVLATGLKPSVYAGHLLAIIRVLPRSPRPVPGVFAARSSEFESRLGAILEPGRRRSGLRPAAARLTAVALFGLLGPLAALHPWEIQRPPSSSSWDGGIASLPVRDARTVHLVESGASGHEPSCGSGSESEPGKAGAPGPAEATREMDDSAHIETGIAGVPGAAESRPPEDDEPETVLSEQSETENWFARGVELHYEGRFAEAIAAFQRSIAIEHRVDASSYNIACGYARLGDPEAAFEWLGRARREGVDLVPLLKQDEDLSSLRDDLRFADLYASEAGSKTS